MLSRALEEDLRKINEQRAAIDAALGSQLERLAAGRDSLARALERRLCRNSSKRV